MMRLDHLAVELGRLGQIEIPTQFFLYHSILSDLQNTTMFDSVPLPNCLLAEVPFRGAGSHAISFLF
jgi:hypothetical protein